jgi:hypothetical protein
MNRCEPLVSGAVCDPGTVTATHAAAHAVAAVVGGLDMRLVQIAVASETDSGLLGYVMTQNALEASIDVGDRGVEALGPAIGALVGTLAGTVAEACLEQSGLADFGAGCCDTFELLDKVDARLLLDAEQDADDWRVRRCLTQLLGDDEVEVEAAREWLLLRTVRLVRAWWSAIEAVAIALIENGTLSGEQVEGIALPLLDLVECPVSAGGAR